MTRLAAFRRRARRWLATAVPWAGEGAGAADAGRRGNRLRAAAALFVVALLGACAMPPQGPDADSDAPDRPGTAPVSLALPASYADALAAWRGPEDVNAWIAVAFTYDLDRADALSETRRAEGPAPAVLDPAAFYERRAGACVDLARFAVETLNRLSPQLKARYLMIEFSPARVRGLVVRRHWVAVYEAADGLRVFADSKRPGSIAGPYGTIDEFVADYARFRGRDVVAYRELASFQRRAKAVQRQRNGDA